MSDKGLAAQPGQGEPALVVGKAYDLCLWLLPKIEKLPRAYKFTVGERLVTESLSLLLSLVEAAPKSVRLRKRVLDHSMRKVWEKRKVVEDEE